MHYERELHRCMELCYGMGDERAESLWDRIRGQTNMGDVVGFSYRLPGQAEVNEVFRQLEKALQSLALVLMGNLNHNGIFSII